MARTPADRMAEAARYKQLTEEATKPVQRREPMPPGYYADLRITQRNGGVRPLFVRDIGGCSDNYR